MTERGLEPADPFAVDEAAVAREAVRIAAIMAKLRAPGGCPWDREQTHATLKKYAVEEVYEMLDAVDAGDDVKLCEELGDVLLQVVFHAQMARERGAFAFADVCAAISEKLIERHPHVFGDLEVTGVGEVLRNWEAIKKAKAAERGDEGRKLLDGVPRSLPALLMAYRIAEKTQHRGESVGTLADRVHADAAALAAAAARAPAEPAPGTGDAAGASRPGDPGMGPEELIARLLQDLARLAAGLGVDPEEALRRRNHAWIEEVHACSD